MTTIGLITDIHLNEDVREPALSALRDVVDRFNDEVRPAYVVVLGDVIHDADSEARDESNLRDVVGVLADLDCPVRYLRGNHDVENLERDALTDALGQEPWGDVVVDDLPLVFLDSSAPWLAGARGEVGDEQRRYLERVAAGADDLVVFVHHPIHYHDVRENYWFGEYPERAFCGNKKEVYSLLDGAVRCTFNGHLHETHHERYRGADHFTIGSFNREVPDAGVTGTHAVARFDGDGVEVDVSDRTGLLESYRPDSSAAE